jgi:hypothetical protein
MTDDPKGRSGDLADNSADDPGKPKHDPLSTWTPAAVDGLDAILPRYGSGDMSRTKTVDGDDDSASTNSRTLALAG